MQLRTGDMWSVFEEADLFLVTTNATLTVQGRLVMGAGIAEEAHNRFPGLDEALGSAISAQGKRYGLLVSPRWPQAKLGAFQTKGHWKDPSQLSLISEAATRLLLWCKAHPSANVHLNFPGIGYGNLPRTQVLELLWELWRAVSDQPVDKVTLTEEHLRGSVVQNDIRKLSEELRASNV